MIRDETELAQGAELTRIADAVQDYLRQRTGRPVPALTLLAEVAEQEKVSQARVATALSRLGDDVYLSLLSRGGGS